MTIVNALKERSLLKEELSELESQTHNPVSVANNRENSLHALNKAKEFLLSLFGRSNTKIIEQGNQTDDEKRISIIKNLLSSPCHEYTISEMQKFLFSCGHREENFHLVTEYFSVINPFVPGSSMSKEPHVRLLIVTLSTISQKHGISLNESESYNQYIKDLFNLGVNWLESGKDMKGFVSMASNLKNVAEKIGLEQEISKTLDEMITNAKETIAGSGNVLNIVTH